MASASPGRPAPHQERRQHAARPHRLVVGVEEREPLRRAGMVVVGKLVTGRPQPLAADAADAAARGELAGHGGDLRRLAGAGVGAVLRGRGQLDEHLALHRHLALQRQHVDEAARGPGGGEDAGGRGAGGDGAEVAAVDAPGHVGGHAAEGGGVLHRRRRRPGGDGDRLHALGSTSSVELLLPPAPTNDPVGLEAPPVPSAPPALDIVPAPNLSGLVPRQAASPAEQATARMRALIQSLVKHVKKIKRQRGDTEAYQAIVKLILRDSKSVSATVKLVPLATVNLPPVELRRGLFAPRIPLRRVARRSTRGPLNCSSRRPCCRPGTPCRRCR